MCYDIVSQKFWCSAQGIKQLRSAGEGMVRLVEMAGFNIFQKTNNKRWKELCAEFDATNAVIVSTTGDLIDASFRYCGYRRA